MKNQITIYVSDDDLKFHKKLKRGQASALYRKALRENAGEVETPELIESQLSNLYAERAKTQSQIESLEKRKERQKEKEKELIDLKAKLEASRKENDNLLIRMWSKDFKAITGRDLSHSDLDDYKQWVEQQRDDGKSQGMLDWLAYLKEQGT